MAQRKSKTPHDRRLSNQERLDVLRVALEGLTHKEIIGLLNDFDPAIIEKIRAPTQAVSWKTELGNFCQARRLQMPQYEWRMDGRSDDPEFYATVRVVFSDGSIRECGTGMGKTKKIAESDAAEKLLQVLFKEEASRNS